MSDDIKPAILSEGDGTPARRNDSVESLPDSSGEGDAASVFERFNPGAVPPDHDGPAADANIESPSRTATAPSIEAEAGDDPQASGKGG